MVSNLEQKIDEDRTHRTLVSGCEGIAVLRSVASLYASRVARETQSSIYFLSRTSEDKDRTPNGDSGMDYEPTAYPIQCHN